MHDPLHNTVFDIPPESASYRELPEELKARLEASYLDGKTVEELKLDSDRQTARSESLRSQHLEAVKERAAREAQRVEEAAARKRRAAEAEKRKLLEKHEAQMKKHEALMAEKDERREADKARRAAMVEAVEANRYAMEVEVLSMGVKKAEREKSYQFMLRLKVPVGEVRAPPSALAARCRHTRRVIARDRRVILPRRRSAPR